MQKTTMTAAVLAAALLLSACGSSGGSDGSSSGSGDEAGAKGPIVVGLLDEQSGPTAAVQGKAGDGARNAVKAINAAGGIDGRQIKLVTRDTKGDPTTTIQDIAELKQAGAVAIVGPVNGALCQAVPTGLDRAKLPGICLSPADLPKDHENLFGIGVELSQVDRAMFDLLAKENGKVGVVAPNTALGGLIDKHIAGYHDKATSFDVEKIEPTATTAKPQLQKLIDKGVDGILIGPCGPLALTAAKEAVDLGYTGKIMLYNCLASDAAAGAIKSFTNGNIVTLASQFALSDVPKGDPQRPAYDAFVKSGTEHDAVAVTGWDGMYLLKKAIEEAGSSDPAAIKAALEDGLDFNGAWSLSHITADDHRGVDPTNALIPVVFTTKGTMEPIQGQ